MKAKRIMALLPVLTLMVALSACGSRNRSSGLSAEAPGEAVEVAAVAEVATVATGKTEETEKATEKEIEAGTEAEPKTELQTEAGTEHKTEINQQTVPAATGSASGSSGSGNSGSGSPAQTVTGSGTSGSSPTPTTAHTHEWKEHTATKQVWVPNIVTVDDYEEKVTEVRVNECYCGMKFYNDSNVNGDSKIGEHMKTNTLEAARNGTTTPCRGSMMYYEYVTETVKVGSHTEDHGHYETSTYVDYYYCTCGAKK